MATLAASREPGLATRKIAGVAGAPREDAMIHRSLVAAVSMTALAFAALPTRAEEGMWTFDNFPIARANQTLGTSIDQAWLDRVRLSSVKFGGCSAGIVSGQGHDGGHVAAPLEEQRGKRERHSL